MACLKGEHKVDFFLQQVRNVAILEVVLQYVN